jgi:hypothetical protein
LPALFDPLRQKLRRSRQTPRQDAPVFGRDGPLHERATSGGQPHQRRRYSWRGEARRMLDSRNCPSLPRDRAASTHRERQPGAPADLPNIRGALAGTCGAFATAARSAARSICLMHANTASTVRRSLVSGAARPLYATVRSGSHRRQATVRGTEVTLQLPPMWGTAVKSVMSASRRLRPAGERK